MKASFLLLSSNNLSMVLIVLECPAVLSASGLLLSRPNEFLASLYRRKVPPVNVIVEYFGSISANRTKIYPSFQETIITFKAALAGLINFRFFLPV